MITLIQLADLHFGSEDQAVMARTAEHIAANRPDGILVCGDLTQNGKRQEFVAAAKWFEAFDVPLLMVPGNHDTPMYDIRARVTSPFRRFRKHFAQYRNVLDIGGIRVAGLNTARGWQLRRNWAEGSVDLCELGEVLSEPVPPDVLVCHHPILPHPAAQMYTRTARGRAASQQIARSPISVVLTGHVHRPSATVWRHEGGQYLAIATGTLSTRVRDHAAGFNVLTFDQEAFCAVNYTFDEADFAEMPLGRWRWPDLKDLTGGDRPAA